MQRDTLQLISYQSLFRRLLLRCHAVTEDISGHVRTVSALMPRKRPLGPFSRAPALAILDGRTKEGRVLRAVRAELLKHVGGNPSATQRALVDRAAWLSLHVALMDAKTLATGGMPSERDSRQYLAWSNTLTRALAALGTKGASAPTKTLAEHLAGRQGTSP